MRSAVEFSARLMSAFGTLADISTALTFSPLVGQSGHRADGAKWPLWA